MLGFNGGLMGVRRTPTGSAASGLWFQNEQSVAKRALIWPTTGDSDWANVSLLLPMNGSNGSTTFTDASSNALTVTANGNAQISTSQSKFGGASGVFDGTDDYLTATLASTLSTGDFTIECWAYLNNNTTTQLLVCIGDYFQPNGIIAYVTNTGRIAISTNNSVPLTGTTETVNATTWTHLACSKSSDTVRLFVDGVQDGSYTNTANYSNAEVIVGGQLYNTVKSSSFNGYLDDCRITRGVARYTANFTPPTAPFPTAG